MAKKARQATSVRRRKVKARRPIAKAKPKKAATRRQSTEAGAVAIIKPTSRGREAIMYSPFDRTGQNPQWNEVSTSEIDHIEFVRRVKHKDDSYPLVRITMKNPNSLEALAHGDTDCYYDWEEDDWVCPGRLARG